MIQLYKKSFQGLSTDVWKISLIYLVNRCGEMVIPFMSLYLTQQIGFTKTQSAIVLFSFGLGALAGSNIGGYLTDSIGNFKVMALSLFGTGIGFIGILLFTSFYPLCGWMFLCAIFSSMFSPPAFSAVGSWGHPDNTSRGYSLLRMAINLGVAIGPAIGGILAKNIGYKWLFIVDGLTCFFALAVLYATLSHRDQPIKKKEKVDHQSASPYKDGILMAFLLLNLLNMAAFFQILFSIPVYFKEIVGLNEMWIGIFFMANGLLIFLFEMPIIYIIEKRGKFFLPLLTGAFLIGLGFFSLSLFSNAVIGIVLYSILIAFGEIINFPLIPTVVMKRSNPHNQGKYMGLVSMMFALAYLLAPITGLPVIEKIGYTSYWYLAGSFSIISAIGLWYLQRFFKNDSDAADSQITT